MKDIIGYVFIVAGVADFLLGNFAQINLTYFLGPLSTFSPYVFGGIGFVLLNYTGVDLKVVMILSLMKDLEMIQKKNLKKNRFYFLNYLSVRKSGASYPI